MMQHAHGLIIENNNKSKAVTLLVSVSLALGLLIPTSINAQISSQLALLSPIIAAFIIGLLFITSYKIRPALVMIALTINAALWTFTFFNPQGYITYKTSILFTTLTVLFCVNFKQLAAQKSILKWFKVVNIIMLIIGWCMIFKVASVANFVVQHYTDFYPELVPHMLMLGKPIISFATHSLASFYMFIFFYLNYRTHRTSGEKKYFLFSINYLYFCFALQSNSGFILLMIGIVLLIVNSKRKYLWSLAAVITTSIFLYLENISFRDVFTIFDPTRNENGFLGRFSTGGNQINNLNYILSNPFSAQGFSTNYSDFIMYDSGIISTTLRGTFLVSILLYVALYLFFKHNVIDRKTGVFLFSIFMIFEIGFDNLLYFRTLFIIPFIILFLNYLESSKTIDSK